MKQGWEIKKLGDVCDFQNGFAFKSKTYKETGLPILRITNIQNQSLEINELVYFDSKDYNENFDRFKVFKDDLVIAMSGATTGKLGINTTDIVFYLNQRVGKFIPKKTLLKPYLYYFLSTKVEESLRIAAGAAQPNLSTEQINNFEIPLPPLPEQQSIVAILDEAFAAIAKAKANAEQNLKNAKELFESYLQGVFENGNKNWETKCLDELGTITSSKRIYKSEYVKDGVPFYRTKEIKELSNGKNITLELFISRERYNEIKKSFGVPIINDLLMSAVGTIGEIMVIENNDEFYFKDGNIVWFKGFKSLDTNYLKFALTAFVEKIKSLAIGAAYSALTIEKLNKYQISFPKTIEEQQTIVQKLDALSTETKKLESIYQTKINDLEELKKSVLQKAFAGELNVGVENFQPNKRAEDFIPQQQPNKHKRHVL